jgi:uncharacterized protein (TIGR02594 family)
MSAPAWLGIARKDLGLRELPGAPTAPRIHKWLADLGAWWRDDETPWCGVAVAAWMRSAGHPIPRHWYRAKAWLDWGTPLTSPVPGCIVVFERQGGGHVGLVVGADARGRLMVLGGNQGNAVTIAPFDRARVSGYRWPPGATMMASAPLPLIASSAASSTNEA